MKSKKYGLLTATSLVVGVVIGIGIFFKAGAVMKAVDGKENLAIAAWIVAALLVGLSAFTISGLASTISENGGLQVYVEKTWGKPLGFVVGFFQSFVYFPALMAGIAFYVGVFTSEFFGIEELWFIVLIGAVALVLVFTVNLLSRFGGLFQQIATYIKVIPLLAVIVGGLFFAKDSSDTAIKAAESFTPSGASAFVLLGNALIPILFAFDGWILVSTMAGDIKNPKKNLPLAILGGLAFISVLYVSFSALLFNIAPGAAYANGYSLFAALGDVFGSAFSKLLNLFIVISSLGVLNGVTMAGYRAPRVVAEAYEMYGHKHMTGISEKTGIPVKSGLVISVVSLIFFVTVAMTGLFISTEMFDELLGLLTDGTVAFMWIIYVLIFVGIAYEIFRKRLKLGTVYIVTAIISAVVGTWAVMASFKANPLYVQVTLIVIVIALAFASKAKKFKNIH